MQALWRLRTLRPPALLTRCPHPYCSCAYCSLRLLPWRLLLLAPTVLATSAWHSRRLLQCSRSARAAMALRVFPQCVSGNADVGPPPYPTEQHRLPRTLGTRKPYRYEIVARRANQTLPIVSITKHWMTGTAHATHVARMRLTLRSQSGRARVCIFACNTRDVLLHSAGPQCTSCRLTSAATSSPLLCATIMRISRNVARRSASMRSTSERDADKTS
jgi:hypothetical protein